MTKDEEIEQLRARVEALENQLEAERPHISQDEEDRICFEWWGIGDCSQRKVTAYLKADYLLKSWGPHITNEMEERPCTAQEITRGMAWLKAAPQQEQE